MQIRVANPKETRSRTVVDSVAQKKANVKQDIEFVDNRRCNAEKVNPNADFVDQRQKTTNIAQPKAIDNRLKYLDHRVAQCTEIDAIKYINKNGLWQGRPRTGNWLIRLLGELFFTNRIEHNVIYNILIKNLPQVPLSGRDGYVPPTVYEVDLALEDEINRLKLLKLQNDFRASSSENFLFNHVRSDKSSAVDRCRDRLKYGKTSNNTVLILSNSEKSNILNTLATAKRKGWDFIYVRCEAAIQSGMSGFYRILGVIVKVSLDQDTRLSHLHGEDLKYQNRDDNIQ